jgi:uncharacterized protein
MLRRPLALGLLSILLGSAPASAAPAIWKVSDADSSVWLFGSVHILPPDIEWRTTRLDKIISKADRVYFETDVSPAGQMSAVPLTVEVAFNQNGVLLSDTIGEKLTARVREAAEAYAIPMPMLLTMRPWMAATALSIGPLTETGYDPALGVETILSAEIPMDRQGFLETPEEQIGFLSSGSDEEQIAMLEATLDTLDIMERDIDTMVEAWMNGEPEVLGEIFMAQMGDYDEGMVERIIDTRNHNWVSQIETMLAENESAVLVVGAAHLVDEVSVVRLLEDLGYTSERVQ